MSKLVLISAKKLWTFFWFLLLLQITILVYVFYVIYTKYPEAKYLRETHLYFYIVFGVIYSLMLYWLYTTSSRIDRELKRIAKLAGTSSYNTERVERRLGQFGQHLNQILSQTLELSDKRRYKISAQKILIDVLTEMLEPFFVLVDLSGNVVSYSPMAKERLGAELQEKRYLGDIILEFEVKHYVAYFSTRSEMIHVGNYQCYPVYDESAMLQYVFILDEEYILEKRMERNLDHKSHKTFHDITI